MRGYESQSNTAFLLVPVGGLGLCSDHARHNVALRFGTANPEQPLRNQQHQSADFYTRRDSAATERSGRRSTESNDSKPEPG